MAKTTKTVKTTNELPKGITSADLKYPGYEEGDARNYDERSFELWFTTGFGWVIPTLDITTSGRRGMPRRTYAVTLKGDVVRVGQGPHVTETVTVYVRLARVEALKPFTDLRTKGLAEAGQVRDRISSRRAQGQMERQAGRRSWYWNV